MPDWAAWPFPADDPYPAYHAARTEGPVQFNERLGCFIVLSHEHAVAVLRDPGWSSDPRNNPELLAAMGGPGPIAELWAKSLLMSDPPTHTRLRTAVNRFFTPRAVDAIRARVTAIVDAALEPLVQGASIEIMDELAYPVPLAVIAELFDIGIEGAQLLRAETPALARMLELDATPTILEAASAAAMTLMLFLVPIVAERRRNPGSDLLSALVQPEDGAVSLETDEIITMCLLLLAAGHETTANLIGNGTLALLGHHDQLSWLHTHPERTRLAVEELLRYDSPVQLASRIARSDVSLGNVHVRKGQPALIALGAANRDRNRYTDPDTLDLARPGPPHLAFGNGPHYCVGAGLARLEGEQVFKRLARTAVTWNTDSYRSERDRSRTFRRLRSLHISTRQPAGSEQTLVAIPAR
jgi:cytochrome P450